jgi:hypothetical protein
MALIDGGSTVLGEMSRLGSRGGAEVIHMSEESLNRTPARKGFQPVTRIDPLS